MQSRLEIPHYKMSREEAQRVDAVRGFLCIAIFCYHFYVDFVAKTTFDNFLLSGLLNDAYIVVQIFFALSGFLIIHSAAKMLNEPHRGSIWPRFFKKRFFRVYPVWIVALTAATIFGKGFELKTYLWNLFLFFGFSPFRLEDLTVVQSWSLFAEEIFYLSFPLFLFCFRKGLLLYLILLFLLGSFIFNTVFVLPEGYFYSTPFDSFPYFFIGIFAYLTMPFWRKMRGTPFVFLFCLFLSLAVGVHFKSQMNIVPVYIGLVFAFIFSAPAGLAQPFELIFEKTGKMCFSIYMVHVLATRTALYLLEMFSGFDASASMTTILFLLSFFVTLIYALIVYRWVEQPFVKLGRTSSQFA